MSSVTPFMRARLAAAQPISAAAPEIRVAVTPELVAGLDAALNASVGQLEPAQKLELECILLQARIMLLRKAMS